MASTAKIRCIFKDTGIYSRSHGENNPQLFHLTFVTVQFFWKSMYHKSSHTLPRRREMWIR